MSRSSFAINATSGFMTVLRRLAPVASRPDLLLALLFVLVALGWTFVPTAFAGLDPMRAAPLHKFQPPSWDHIFGTDALGRDLYARVVHGAAACISAVLIAVAIALLAGSLIGLISGYAGGMSDECLMRCIDILLAIPNLLLSFVIMTALGPGMVNIAIAVGVSSIAAFARVMRSEVLRVARSPYVEAARICGGSTSGILFRHILPNAAGPIMVLAIMEIGLAILSVSSLSFLGFGVVPPRPEWGSLIAEGRSYLATAWWLTTMPGLVIIGVVLAVTRIAKALDRNLERGGR